MTNNEQVENFIINTDNQMRSVDRLLDIAIFELSGMVISEKKARKKRDDIIAFLNGAKALAETSIASTKTIMEELNFLERGADHEHIQPRSNVH